MFSKDDFLRMGIGIKARHARCQLWWEPHLQCCREFIERSLEPGQTVAVLGAGRLLDIDILNLASKFERIYLFDADSSCLSHWRRVLGKTLWSKVTPCIEELTDTIDSWAAQLGKVAKRQECRDFLCSLEAQIPRWASRQFDAVISLNLLGQIPLYWRDRVLKAHKQLLESEWSALQVSMGRLQAAHLQALMAVGATQIVLLTDTEYYFYHVDQSQWRVEPALFGDGLRAFQDIGTRCCVQSTESWLWHLAPQFVESDEEGEIHRVEAISFSRLARA